MTEDTLQISVGRNMRRVRSVTKYWSSNGIPCCSDGNPKIRLFFELFEQQPQSHMTIQVGEIGSFRTKLPAVRCQFRNVGLAQVCHHTKSCETIVQYLYISPESNSHKIQVWMRFTSEVVTFVVQSSNNHCYLFFYQSPI
jgi:hypothetical protein